VLADLLQSVQPGALLAAIEGNGPWPFKVFEQYWRVARSDSFQPARGGPDARPAVATAA